MNPAWILALLLPLAVACDALVQNTVAWPSQVVRGQTVSMAIDSNFAAPGRDVWDLSRANVTVVLDWGAPGAPDLVTITEDDGLRVIEAWPHPSAVVDSFQWPTTSRGWVAIVAFDIPEDPVIPTADLPTIASIEVRKDGQAIPTGFGSNVGGQVEIVDGGTPPFLLPEPDDLEPPPLLRLVAKADAGKFDDPAWPNPTIGSIEFEIEHPAGLTVRKAHGLADAAGATVLVGPGSAQYRQRVVLVDANGFTLEEDAVNRPDVAGDGPFLDIAFEPGTPFQESNFAFYNLVVADIDGNVLIEDIGAASGYFDLYIRGPRP
jgi:hypothetical protein